MNRVKIYLEQVAPHVDLMRFVLEYGQPFTWRKLPKSHRHGMLGACFKNSALLAIRDSLTYVEGYASIYPGQRPMLHAWCVDQHGLVFDRTWGHEEIAYFGVPIKSAYLKKMHKLCGTYGVLDQWKWNYPILQAQASDFLMVLNNK